MAAVIPEPGELVWVRFRENQEGEVKYSYGDPADWDGKGNPIPYIYDFL